MVTEPNALREKLAYELFRWGNRQAEPDQAVYADFDAARLAADAVIAALLTGERLRPITHHPLVEWIANNFIVHWDQAAFGLAASGIGEPATPPDPLFRAVFRTTAPGEAIKLALRSGYDYDFEADWGDATQSVITAWNQAEINHVYATAGDHPVTLTGDIGGFDFVSEYYLSSGMEDKLIEITNWGDNVWDDMYLSFWGCNNLHVSAVDAPDLSQAHLLGGLFAITPPNALQVNPVGLAKWLTAEVTSLYTAFGFSIFTGAGLEHWDVSNVENFIGTLSDTPNLTVDLSGWNVSSGIHFWGTFRNSPLINFNFSGWDMSSAANIREFIAGCTSCVGNGLHAWDIRNVTEARNFATNSGLTTVNYDLLLQAWSLLPVQPGVVIDFSPTKYTSAAVAARAVLTGAPHNWIITDGGLIGATTTEVVTHNGETVTHNGEPVTHTEI